MGLPHVREKSQYNVVLADVAGSIAIEVSICPPIWIAISILEFIKGVGDGVVLESQCTNYGNLEVSAVRWSPDGHVARAPQ